MVYLEPHQLGWEPLLASWLATLPPALGGDLVATIAALLRAYLPPCLRWVRTVAKEQSPTEPAALATAAMRLVSAQLDEFMAPEGGEEGAAAPRAPVDIEGVSEAARIKRVEAAVVFALVWGVGATGGAECRERFDTLLRALAAGTLPEVRLCAQGHACAHLAHQDVE